MNHHLDILVIGGGHAGMEAAWMASQFPSLQVGLISMPGVALASAPCNPAIGGVGKGQVVREIDALGGIMGKLADLSAIQYRTLNTSKGYAVQSTRVQIDKEEYSRNAELLMKGKANIALMRDRVDSVKKENGTFLVKTQSGREYAAFKVILTTGTFLNGKLHSGKEQTAGGRRGCSPSLGMANIFSQVKTLPKRFKTGTPPRLKRETVNFSVMEEQCSDQESRNFHCLHPPYTRKMTQVSCFITKTNPQTLKIIRDNKDQSPLFNGQIQGVGPRYCPSIEDKAYRYPDRDSHHIFVEPEGLNLDTLYPNGISTSLPLEIQEAFIQTIPGLEKAEIAVPGYAVEYDVVDTTTLNSCLESQDIPGLYFAGQVNGTSGYEEAAGQGLVAGINAACNLLNKPPLVLDRQDSYIGVMIEDLISNRRDEPYRLFTARSENRLYIREDNVLERMFPYRQKLGLSQPLDHFLEQFHHERTILSQLCEGFSPNSSRSLSEMLKQADCDPVKVLQQQSDLCSMEFLPGVVQCVAISKKYEGYIHRAEDQNQKMRKLDHMKLNWEDLVNSKNISFECRERILEIRPSTFGQLKLIEGIRPATLAIAAGKLW